MAEREVSTPLRVPADPEGKTTRVVDLGFAYEDTVDRTGEVWMAPDRNNPSRLIAKGIVLGDLVALTGVPDREHTIIKIIYPDLGRDRNGETIEGEPMTFRFLPTSRERQRFSVTPGLGLIVVENNKGHIFIDGHSRIVTSQLFAEPIRLATNGTRRSPSNRN